jgi:RHS repeat-associated protein
MIVENPLRVGDKAFFAPSEYDTGWTLVKAGTDELQIDVSAKVNVESPSNEVLGVSRSTELGVAGGEHIATYENDLFTPTTFFTHVDHLGTERVETAVNGTTCETTISLPFGDGLNTSGSCDPTELRFTGKERDAETGLDNFGARYNNSIIGRFMTPDWDAKPTSVPYAEFGDPQSLNLYSYVRNNPLSKTDLDGHDWGTAWQDLKTFARSIYVKVSVGVGVEVKVTAGSNEAQIGVSAKVNVEAPSDKLLSISKSTEIGAATTTNGEKFGENVSVEKPLATLNDDYTISGPEAPKVDVTDSIGGNSTVNASNDQIGVGVEAGLPVIVGGEIGTTTEGLSALSDIIPQLTNMFFQPPPPPLPPPPSPSSPPGAGGGHPAPFQ